MVYSVCPCLNMAQAQSTPQSQQFPTSILPVTTLPTVNPPGSISAPPAVPVVTPGKYAEYKSYCRSNDFDETTQLTAEQRKRRIALLETKLTNGQSAKLSSKAIVPNALIKEFLGEKNLKAAKAVYVKYKNDLTAEDIIIWETEFDLQENKTTTASILKLEKYTIDNPTSKKALLKLAQVKKSLFFYSEAEEILLDLQRSDKKLDYSVDLCELYTLDSQYKDAEKHCLKASKQNADNPIPLVYLGIAYRERELYKEAQEFFEDSLKKRKTEFAYTCLGELFYLKKDNQKTIEYLNQAVAQNKLSYRAQIGLAIAEFKEKKYPQALVNFKHACRLGNKDTLEMRKALKTLEEQNSIEAKNYYDAIQDCKLQSSF